MIFTLSGRVGAASGDFPCAAPVRTANASLLLAFLFAGHNLSGPGENILELLLRRSRVQIERQLDELKLYLENVEDFLTHQAQRAETKEEQIKMEEYFPNLLRSSLFVTIYSMLENELNRLCYKLSKRDGLTVDDLRGNGIIRASTFLIKVCRVDFPEDSPEWKLLRQYNQLRNDVVHNNGIVIGNHLDKAVKKIPGFDLGQGNAIRLNREFCPEVLKTVREFFQKLSAALD